MKLRTFDKRSAPAKIKVKNKDVVVRTDREIFARLLVIQKNRNTSLKEVIQFELSPTPLSLSNLDSSTTLRKTAKTELLKYLKFSIELVEDIPENTKSIHNGMVLFQKLPLTLISLGVYQIASCKR